MKKTKTGDLVRIALFAAIIAVLSQISIPMPSGVPVTLQTFAIALAGYALGCKRGAASVVVFLLLGAVGVPVFANFTGGFVKLIGVTGGFLWGFIPMAAICGVGFSKKNKILAIVAGVIGLVVCHVFGVMQFAVVASTTVLRSFLTVSAPYFVKDVISVVIAYAAATAVNAALSREQARG